MYPTLFTIGDFPIGTFGVMLAIGFYMALMVSDRRAPLFGLKREDVASLGMWGILGGIIGARILYIIIDWEGFLHDPIGIVFSRRGFVFSGGLIGGVVASIIWTIKKKKPFWQVADLAAPAIPLAHGFGRLGCFLNGCCFGRCTDHLGVRFPRGSDVYHYHLQAFSDQIGPEAQHSLPVIPTQVYSAAFLFLLAGFLLWYGRRRSFVGQVFFIYAVSYSAFRFIIEFFRANLKGIVGPLSSTQILCLIVLAAAPFVYQVLSRRSEKTVPAGSKSVS